MYCLVFFKATIPRDRSHDIFFARPVGQKKKQIKSEYAPHTPTPRESFFFGHEREKIEKKNPNHALTRAGHTPSVIFYSPFYFSCELDDDAKKMQSKNRHITLIVFNASETLKWEKGMGGEPSDTDCIF